MANQPTGGKCDFCEKQVGAEAYCHGCGIYVCEDCEGHDEPWGDHDPQDPARPDTDD